MGFAILPGNQRGESFMSVLSTWIGRLLTVRPMDSADLPRLFSLEMQRLGSHRVHQESPICSPSANQGIWVAVIQNGVVGYLVYQVLGEEAAAANGPASKSPSAASSQAPRIALQHLYVAPDWRRRGIGRSLVERFEPDLSGPEGCWVEVAVPETNLPLQLLLRSAGYKAVRVLRRYYGDEDAYLMEQYRD